MDAIGRLADAANHHPDVDLRYSGVTVRLLPSRWRLWMTKDRRPRAPAGPQSHLCLPRTSPVRHRWVAGREAPRRAIARVRERLGVVAEAEDEMFPAVAQPI